MQWVEELIRADRRITIDSVATALRCSHGLAYSVMHDRLKFWKVCARWVPREVKNQEKFNRMGLSLQHLLRLADEGQICLTDLLLGTNHGCITTNPNLSVLQCNPNSPSTKKFKVMSTPSAGKVMLTVVWDYQGVLLAYFQKRGEDVKSASYEYREILLKFRDAVCRKRFRPTGKRGTASS
jgi:hypothetical protein